MLACAAGAGESAAPFVLLAAGRGRAAAWRFWLELPLRLAGQLRQFRPEAVIAQSPFEAAAALIARVLARSRAVVICDVQGDWRSASRLYGGPSRRLLSRLADTVAAAALRRRGGTDDLSVHDPACA